MRTPGEQIDHVRRRSSEVENHLIDQLVDNRISRREFIRRGTVLGMSLPVLGLVATACGTSSSTTAAGSATTAAGSATTAAAGAAGATIRNGITQPSGAIDPVTVADEGGLAVLGQSGEYLCFSTSDLSLRPVLAEKWSPNDDGSVWTFNLRRGVKFHDGTEMKAADVVASIEGIADGNAASAFSGVLSKGNTRAVDDYTVEFTLDAPNGNFPYIVSSDNYNAIVLPAAWWASYTEGAYEKDFPGTGPWLIEKFEQGVEASFTKNPDYWNAAAVLPAKTQQKFYGDEPSMITAFLANEIDVIMHFSVANGAALLDSADTKVIDTRSAAHRQVHMATDVAPFTDKRVRQAIALSLARPDIVTGLFNGKADVGNDHPFAPVFPSTDTTQEQRTQNIAQAKQLVSDAGADGASVKFYGWNGFEMPAYGQLIQAAAAEIGITIELQFDDAGTYYSNYWLDSPMGVTDYGHRGVPNVYLSAPLRSDGTWNAAHYNNPAYDALVDEYTASFDLDSQRTTAGKIQRILTDDVPVIFAYFYNFLTATKPNIGGVEVSAMGHINLQGATG